MFDKTVFSLILINVMAFVDGRSFEYYVLRLNLLNYSRLRHTWELIVEL